MVPPIESKQFLSEGTEHRGGYSFGFLAIQYNECAFVFSLKKYSEPYLELLEVNRE